MKYLKLYEDKLSKSVYSDDVREFIYSHVRTNVTEADLNHIKNFMKKSLSRQFDQVGERRFNISDKEVNNVLDNIRLIKDDRDTLDKEFPNVLDNFISIVGSILDSKPDYSTYVNLLNWIKKNEEFVIGRSYVYKFEDEWWLIWHYANNREVPYIIDSLDGLKEFFNTVY